MSGADEAVKPKLRPGGYCAGRYVLRRERGSSAWWVTLKGSPLARFRSYDAACEAVGRMP